MKRLFVIVFAMSMLWTSCKEDDQPVFPVKKEQKTDDDANEDKPPVQNKLDHYGKPLQMPAMPKKVDNLPEIQGVLPVWKSDGRWLVDQSGNHINVHGFWQTQSPYFNNYAWGNDYNYDEDGNNVLWSGNVSIAASPSALISMSSVSVKNLVSGTKNINDDKFTVSVKATNSGNDYTDYIEGRIYRRSGSNSGSMISSIAKSVSIASNRYKTVTFEFTDLVPGEEYFVIFYYYSGGVLTKGSSTSFYTILGSPYDSCDINKDGVVDVSDLNIIISRILGDSSTDTYNRADVNGDGVVDVTDINLVISKILAQ